MPERATSCAFCFGCRRPCSKAPNGVRTISRLRGGWRTWPYLPKGYRLVALAIEYHDGPPARRSERPQQQELPLQNRFAHMLGLKHQEESTDFYHRIEVGGADVARKHYMAPNPI